MSQEPLDVIGHLVAIEGGSLSMHDCGTIFWFPHMALSSRKNLREVGLERWMVLST